MKAEIKSWSSPDVELDKWSPERPEELFFLLELEIGPAGEVGADLFSLAVASPQAISGKPERRSGRFLVVDKLDWPELRRRVAGIVSEASDTTWPRIAENLCEHFNYEFEEYKR